MSYDGGGKPGKGSGDSAMSLNGIPFAVTRAVKRIARDASQQGVGAGAGSHRSVQSIGREAAPTFFRGGQKTARAKAEHRRSLDPDG